MCTKYATCTTPTRTIACIRSYNELGYHEQSFSGNRLWIEPMPEFSKHLMTGRSGNKQNTHFESLSPLEPAP